MTSTTAALATATKTSTEAVMYPISDQLDAIRAALDLGVRISQQSILEALEAVKIPFTENPEFIAEIVANPECDTVRLVYADWLDEHGFSDRAEYIRLAIETSDRRRQEPNFDRRNFHRKCLRLDYLWKLHEREWFFSYQYNAKFWAVRYSRGFLSEIAVSAKSITENLSPSLESLLQKQPIEKITATRWRLLIEELATAIPTNLRTLHFNNGDVMTWRQLRIIADVAKNEGWIDTLQEMQIDNIAEGEVNDVTLYALAAFPKQRLLFDTIRQYSKQDENGDRTFTEI